MTTFALVGTGYRARAYERLAARFDDLTCVGVVTRRPAGARRPAYPSVTACVTDAHPDFLVTAVPRTAHPAILAEAVEHGVPVLAETPPAADLAGLRALWRDVGASGLVQVAEQYHRMPSHAARLAAVRAGVIGTPTQVHVSSTQLYHAVSLIRGYLGCGRGPVTVRASRTSAPLVDPLTRAGWTDDPEPKPATTTIATLDFGDGRSGLYDFTTNQTRNQLRFRRVLVRGSHGELYDDEVLRWTAARTVVRTPIVRHDDAHLTLGDRVLFAGPYRHLRLNDDEVATAAILRATADWVRGAGPAPYPLADGTHDQQVALAIEEAADTDRPVTTTIEPWT